jgi:hypothetical protein
MAGQVDDLAWSLSLLARSWNSDVDLRTASRRSCLNKRRSDPLGALRGFFFDRHAARENSFRSVACTQW